MTVQQALLGEALEALERLTTAARRRENVMGDPASLLTAKSELESAVRQGNEVINKIKGL